MGNCCVKNTQISTGEVEKEGEISIEAYSSIPDKQFSKIEVKFNLLRDIHFIHYMYSLVHFSLENATIADDYTNAANETYTSKDAFYNEEFGPEMVQSFLDNKILHHPSLYVKAGEDELLTSTFKEIITLNNKGLVIKLKQKEEKIGNANPNIILTKSHAVALGILYCGGSNISKIKVIFNLFANQGKISKSEEFSEFLISLFLIPSYCMLHVRTKIPYTNSDIENLERESLQELIDSLELKDSMNLVDLFEKENFNSGESYDYDEFKELFKNKIGWMISPKGIRRMQEKNNV